MTPHSTASGEGPAEAEPHGETTITLRVAEARVEDIAHAIARMTRADMERIGARAGDILKISGRTVAFTRAAMSDPGHEGVLQIDGTVLATWEQALPSGPVGQPRLVFWPMAAECWACRAIPPRPWSARSSSCDLCCGRSRARTRL